jgi:hypothetical protein
MRLISAVNFFESLSSTDLSIIERDGYQCILEESTRFSVRLLALLLCLYRGRDELVPANCAQWTEHIPHGVEIDVDSQFLSDVLGVALRVRGGDFRDTIMVEIWWKS